MNIFFSINETTKQQKKITNNNHLFETIKQNKTEKQKKTGIQNKVRLIKKMKSKKIFL